MRFVSTEAYFNSSGYSIRHFPVMCIGNFPLNAWGYLIPAYLTLFCHGTLSEGLSFPSHIPSFTLSCLPQHLTCRRCSTNSCQANELINESTHYLHIFFPDGCETSFIGSTAYILVRILHSKLHPWSFFSMPRFFPVVSSFLTFESISGRSSYSPRPNSSLPSSRKSSLIPLAIGSPTQNSDTAESGPRLC